MVDLIPSLVEGIPQPRKTVFWTQAETAHFRELWANKDLSLSAIGDILGKSRNAVAGKRYRLDLPHRQPSGPNGLSATTQRVRRAARRSNLPSPRQPKPKPELPPLPVVIDPPVQGGVHIADLEYHHCRFITHYGEDDGLARYCGAGRMPAYDRYGRLFWQSWCAEHCNICLVPPRTA